MAQAWRVWIDDGHIKGELGYDDAAALPVLVNQVRYVNTYGTGGMSLDYEFYKPASTFPDSAPLFAGSVPPQTPQTTRNIPAGLNIRLQQNPRNPTGPLMPADWVLATRTG